VVHRAIVPSCHRAITSVRHGQEFVVGGYKPENRSFQSLVVGYYEKKPLRFAGRVRAGRAPDMKILK
jgi:hypothetical protein